MRKNWKVGQWMAGVAVVGAVVTAVMAVTALTTPAQAGITYCPDVYAPVICDGGRIYSNSCYASKAHATGCVPYGTR